MISAPRCDLLDVVRIDPPGSLPSEPAVSLGVLAAGLVLDEPCRPSHYCSVKIPTRSRFSLPAKQDLVLHHGAGRLLMQSSGAKHWGSRKDLHTVFPLALPVSSGRERLLVE